MSGLSVKGDSPAMHASTRSPPDSISKAERPLRRKLQREPTGSGRDDVADGDPAAAACGGILSMEDAATTPLVQDRIRSSTLRRHVPD